MPKMDKIITLTAIPTMWSIIQSFITALYHIRITITTKRELYLWNDNFIWYCGGSDIVLCCNCAESVITGMSRDLLEIKGHSEYKGKPADNVNPLYLKQENERLIKRCLVYIKQIVDLQELLARQR